MRSRSGSAMGRVLLPEPQTSVWARDARTSAEPICAAGDEKGTRSESVVRNSNKRCSVVFANTQESSEQMRARPPGDGITVPKPDLHPGLTRLTSFMKRKSVFRGKMASINELSSAMDTLGQRILSSLEAIRSQNASGLGHIRALHGTKSGKLVPNRSPSAKEMIPAYSPRKLLGDAVDDASILQRLRFHIDEQQALHDGGISSARGRLQDGTADDKLGALQQSAQPHESSLAAASPDKKRHTIAVPNLEFGSPMWGATEGGRDTLGWVRSLVKFSEAQPIMDIKYSSQDTISALEKLAEDGPEPNIGRPARREDVFQLQAWLQEMMGQALAQVGSRSPGFQEGAGAGAGSEALIDKAPLELAESALWIYGVAFEELQRQVTTESKDRAELLGAMWEHCFNLVELRCSLMYEEIIAGIKQELQSARKHRQQLQSQVKQLDVKINDSVVYNKEEFLEMQAEKKRATQLLAAAQEENDQTMQEVLRLKRALEVESSTRSNTEAELRSIYHKKDELAQEVKQLTSQVQQQSETLSSNEALIAELKGDLQYSREQARLLSEEKTNLEVDIKQTTRDYQAAEIRAMSLKEQLNARNNEVAQLRSEHGNLQERHVGVCADLQDAKSSLQSLRQDYEVQQRTAADIKSELQRSVDKLDIALRESHSQVAALHLEKQGVDNRLKESIARENVFSSQLKQLTASHEQQGIKLRQETEARKIIEDELQALRAGLQVAQQKLEGLGLVFASNVVHHASSQAWAATGPISMGRQVVAVVNQQLTDLVAKQRSLEHDLAVAKEHWQAEESVRVRHQDQLLDTKAQLSKMATDKEALDDLVARLEKQRHTLDNEVSQMRKLVSEAEARAQAAHRKSIEAAAESKRLQPFESKLAEVKDRLQASKVEGGRLQQEIALQQSTITKLLDEKAAVLEELSHRTQALDAATASCKHLSEEAKKREHFQDLHAQLQDELAQHLKHRSAQEAVLQETMRQLAVAKQLLEDLNEGAERSRLGAADAEVRRLKQLLAEKGTEVELLQQRLSATEQQLRHLEKQLQVVPALPHSPRLKGSPRESLEPVVEHLKRVLEIKEDRIRQLERGSGAATATTVQVKQLHADVARKDAEISKLDKELDAVRKKLHSLQEGHMKMASRDLIALATDAHLPHDLAKEMMHKHVHGHLRSELLWTKAKLAFVSYFARNLRLKLQTEQEHRARAELESVCVEAFYLQQAIADQRATSSLFHATFAQVHQSMAVFAHALDELQQIVEPGREDLGRLQIQLEAVLAGLGHWVHRHRSQVDKAMQADSQEESIWQQLVKSLPEARPPSDSTLAPAALAATIIPIYAHSIQPCLNQARSISPHETVFDAMAAFFVEQRGCSRQEVISCTGPVASLLAAARVHQHRAKQLLLLMLTGLSDQSGARAVPGTAWRFVRQILLCTARLHGASWQTFVKEWSGSEEGAALPLQCVMDILANVYNTDAPALLECARRSLVPLIRQGRRGPAIDMDAFLLVMLSEFSEGRCPVDPLSYPRRLTDGSLANALNYHANPPALPSLMCTSVSMVAGLADPYAPAPLAGCAHPQEGRRQRGGAMRKRIVNLTDGEGGAHMTGGVPVGWGREGEHLLALSSGAHAGSPQAGVQGVQGSSPGGSCGAPLPGVKSPGETVPCSGGGVCTTWGRIGGRHTHGDRGGSAGSPGGAPRSPGIYHTMHSLSLSNPDVPMGADSPLRRSAATGPAHRAGLIGPGSC